MNRTRNATTLLVVRGSISVELGPLLDPSCCGELERPARDAVLAFHECERFLDQAAARLVDLLYQPGRLPDHALVEQHAEIVGRDQLASMPALPEPVPVTERQLLGTLRTLAMSAALLTHRQLTELGRAVDLALAGPERDYAAAIHAELLQLARGVGMDQDIRHPFQHLWPRTVARAVRVERPRQPIPRPARFAPAPAQSFDEGAFDSELQFEGSIR